MAKVASSKNVNLNIFTLAMLQPMKDKRYLKSHTFYNVRPLFARIIFDDLSFLKLGIQIGTKEKSKRIFVEPKIKTEPIFFYRTENLNLNRYFFVKSEQ